MIRVSTIPQRNKLNTTELVHVKGRRIDKLFRLVDGEWIERAYFTTAEIADICGVTQRQVQNALRKLQVRTKAMNGTDLSIHHVRLIARAIKMREQNINYTSIRKQLGV